MEELKAKVLEEAKKQREAAKPTRKAAASSTTTTKKRTSADKVAETVTAKAQQPYDSSAPVSRGRGKVKRRGKH